MCLMNQKPVIYEPCSHCPEYLNSCMPIVVNSFIFGECDQNCYCSWCSCYDECIALIHMTDGIKAILITGHDVISSHII